MSKLAQMREWFEDRFGAHAENPVPRYVLLGVLGAIILGCAVLTIGSLVSGGGGGGAQRDMHFWCVETKAEFIFEPDEVPPDEMDMSQGYRGTRVTNPKTGRRTLVPMTQCPKCKKYFITDAQMDADAAQPRSRTAGARLICTHCKTDVQQWFRQNARKNR